VCVLCVLCERDIERDETKTETRRRKGRGRDRTGGRDAGNLGIASLFAFLLNSFEVEPLLWLMSLIRRGGYAFGYTNTSMNLEICSQLKKCF
jgi:hypothetical protein